MRISFSRSLRSLDFINDINRSLRAKVLSVSTSRIDKGGSILFLTTYILRYRVKSFRNLLVFIFVSRNLQKTQKAPFEFEDLA